MVARFEEVVSRYPDNCALRWDRGAWSYAQLNTRANRLAHLLVSLGVKPEMPVGVFAWRSPETLLAFLAILKAGGAYVPLDPSYPADLIQFYLEDARIPLVLIAPEWESRLPVTSAKTIPLRENLAGDQPGKNPDLSIGPQALAQILFTSGSTGKPKGVLIEQRGVLRVTTEIDYAEVGPADVFLQDAPLNFDASTFEIWASWLNGACLALPAAGIISLHDLGNVIRSFHVSTLWLTSGLFQLMVEQEIAAFANVRQLLTGGDIVSPVHAERLLKTYPNIRLINGYGPTENTVFTSCHRIKLEVPMPDRLSIGRPVRGTDVLILDENLQPAPPGGTGEIVITGEGLARGYLNRPDLTARSFVEVRDKSGNRVRGYRSGDLGRYRPDGTIEFFGRSDHQVKIRGLRIELDEMENILQSHPDVSHAVVLPVGAGDQKHLEAYVVPRPGLPPSERGLRQFLMQKIPANWLPSSIHFLSTLPLNANGKVDRKSFRPLAPAFPELDASSAEPAVSPSDARDNVEKAIWTVWREILPAAPIGRADNFFDLGGDSLSAMNMLAQVEKALDRKLTLQPLMEEGTIAALAAAARRTGPVPTPPLMTRIQSGTLPSFFFAHGDYLHGGLFCQSLARQIGPDRPFYAIGTPGFYDGKLPGSIDEVAATNLELIRSVQPKGPYYLGGFCNAALAMYAVAQRLVRAGETVATLVMLDPPDFCFPHFKRELDWLCHALRLGSRRRILIEDLLTESVYRWKSEGAGSAARYVAGRLIRYPLMKLKGRSSAGRVSGSDAINLNFYYVGLIMAYDIKPYLGHGSVIMLLRRGDAFRHPDQTKAWRRPVPHAKFETVMGTHLDFRDSLPDIARCIRAALDSGSPT
jgi:amino acid adenylation domain-containing protein